MVKIVSGSRVSGIQGIAVNLRNVITTETAVIIWIITK